MKQWPFLLLFVPIFGFAVYKMYCSGLAVTKSIMALLFVFDPGKNGDRVRLDSCTGWVSHVGCFRESRMYEFVLDARLTKGSVEVLLLNQKKMPLLRLNKWHPVACIELDGSSRYFLRWEFSNATGDCELRW
ncbi:MAG: hypothetical protein HDT14_10125 [Oscillibacter sp.]|nr:hypothetical protein [Oscillibacter sp.]